MERTSAAVPAGYSALHAGSANPPHAACCLSPRHWCQPLIPHLACSDLPSDLLRPPPAVFPCQKATAAIRHGPAASIVGEIGAHHTRAENTKLRVSLPPPALLQDPSFNHSTQCQIWCQVSLPQWSLCAGVMPPRLQPLQYCRPLICHSCRYTSELKSGPRTALSRQAHAEHQLHS